MPSYFNLNRTYGSIFLLVLLPVSFRALFAVVCSLFCALLLSNVSFGIHGCSNVSCGIDCMHSIDVLLFRMMCTVTLRDTHTCSILHVVCMIICAHVMYTHHS